METCFFVVSVNQVSVRHAISILLIFNIASSSVLLSLPSDIPKLWRFVSRTEGSLVPVRWRLTDGDGVFGDGLVGVCIVVLTIGSLLRLLVA